MNSTIEIRGPDVATQIDLPAHWTIHDVTAVRQILEAAGYESAVPTTDSLFAYQRAEDRAVMAEQREVS